jgi:hypothetical protein
MIDGAKSFPRIARGKVAEALVVLVAAPAAAGV